MQVGMFFGGTDAVRCLRCCQVSQELIALPHFLMVLRLRNILGPHSYMDEGGPQNS